jgi:putative phage-type endonuclease
MLATEIAAFPVALDRLVLRHRDELGVFAPERSEEQAAIEAAEQAAASIAATLSAVYGRDVPAALVLARVERARACRPRLAELLAAPGIAQRTEPWYAARRGLVTASDISSALGSAKYGTQKEFFKKKCGAESEQRAFCGGAPPLKWGVMYEPVANAIYCARNRVEVHEFGLLAHRTVVHLGASPDGINELGVMLEIKCPFSRKIDGVVPREYYHQIQGQLEVCGLDDCDYMECEFEEAPNLLPDPRYTDVADIGDELGEDAVEALEAARAADVFYEACALPGAAEHGVVFERVGEDGCTISYSYSSVGAGPEHAARLRAWEAEEAAAIRAARADRAAEAGGGTEAAPVVHRWRLVKLGTVRVTRDPEFVADMLDGLAHVWQRVTRYRGDREAYQAEVLEARRAKPTLTGAPGSTAPAGLLLAGACSFMRITDD